jgi:septum site-determining protein MinC
MVNQPEVQPKIQIKGIREGLLITAGEGDWPAVREALLDQVDQQGDFLRGGRLILDVGDQVLRAAELGQLRDTLSESGLSLYAVISNSLVTQETARALGLATRITKPIPERSAPSVETALTGEGAVLVRRTLRSGFSLQHKGHVVVIGDVNPGSEIAAGGDVVVWGRLRGMVHAGAEGDEGAVVCALDLDPTQLRIAGQIAITPKRRGKPQPEMVRLVDGQVVAEAWSIKK